MADTNKSDDASAVALAEWVRSFHSAAADDNCRSLRSHLDRLELACEPDLLLEGTILVVQTCVAHLELDNRSIDGFLARQRYDLAESDDSHYLLTIDIFGQAFARVVIPVPFDDLDLADLYETPWVKHKLVGFCQLFLSRADGKDLMPNEIETLDDAVTRDLRFDYAEDELAFWFDPDSINGVLVVSVQDVYDEE